MLTYLFPMIYKLSVMIKFRILKFVFERRNLHIRASVRTKETAKEASTS